MRNKQSITFQQEREKEQTEKFKQTSELAKVIAKELRFIFLLMYLKIAINTEGKIFSIHTSETTPSMGIIPVINKMKCFATGIVVNIIEFYRIVVEQNFYKAVEQLNEILALQNLEDAGLYKKVGKRKQISDGLYDCESATFHELIKKYSKRISRKEFRIILAKKLILIIRQRIRIKVYEFIANFCKADGFTEDTYNYLIGKYRKLSKSIIKRFRLFELHEPSKLLKALKLKFSDCELIISGVLNSKGKFLFFNNRLFIPYIEEGQITYLRARHIPTTATTSRRTIKYLGLAGISPKRIFNKDVLINLKKDSKLLICEGEMDTVKSVDAGFSNTIGIPGATNIPFDELRNLKINEYDITLAFDNDNAGKLAAHKFVDELQIKVKIMKFKKGNDLTEELS